MIDCKVTENFLCELLKMCRNISCGDCELSCCNNSEDETCNVYVKKFPKEAIAVVQSWSDAHPLKTFLSDFLEKHPKAPLREVGIPIICTRYLGYTENVVCSDNKCVDCWNTPLEDNQND